MAERRLIVNADDLGRSIGINDGIFEAHEQGVVTSATLMVGQPAAADAAARVARYPRLGLGLHVTLTGARPTLPATAVASLIDGEGLLPRRPEGKAGARFETAVSDEVLAEVEHQLERFRDLIGSPPTHLDSHHHAHRRPVVLDALVVVAKRLGLPVRRSSPTIAARLAAEGIATTEAFVESFYGDGVSEASLMATLADLPAGVTEIMCHPGRTEDRLRRESAYADQRELEIDVLTRRTLAERIEALGIRRITFAELHQ